MRHKPLQFGVALDEEGFADLDELVVGIRHSHYDWATLDRTLLEETIRTGSARFEIRGNRVRARYGHSVILGQASTRCVPPKLLYHGTSHETVAIVLTSGLRSMNRSFVHLTSDPDYAQEVAASKGGGVVLRVRSREAARSGIEFFRANDHVWLAVAMPPEHLTVEACTSDLKSRS